MRRQAVFIVLAACGGNVRAPEAPALVVPALQRAPETKAACAIEGAGEPVDKILFSQAPEPALAATRDGLPLVQTQGDARHKLHGRWTELSPPHGDGRARLELEHPNEFRIAGYTDLAGARFRLRREVAVVPEHVFLQADALVRIVGADDGQLEITGDVPFRSPAELSTRAPCEDVGYEPIESPYVDAVEAPTGHLTELQLFDAPHGRLQFEADTGLVYVRELEVHDAWTRVEGMRYRVRFVGWTPSDRIDHTPTGSGYGAGSSRHSSSRPRGRETRIARSTALLARRGNEAPAAMGEIASGTKVLVTGEDGELVTVHLASGKIIAAQGASLLVRAADVE